MTHLSRERLLEAVEAETTPDAAAHLASCARCRAEVDGLRQTLDEVRVVDVPEPSPLFWDHLTQRVREAIAAEPEPVRAGIRPWWRPALAAALVLAVAVLVERGVRRAGPAVGKAPAVAAAGVTPQALSSSDAWALDAGDDWQFIVDVAAASATHDGSVSADESVETRIGSADLGVSELSADEQRELVKLLNDALAQARVEARPAKGDV